MAIRPTSEGWRPVPRQKAVRQEQFQDVVWTGARFVAVGFGDFLDSDDGITWHRQSNPKRWQPMSIAAGPAGIVAVGGIGGKLSSWFSSGGLTWKVSRDAFPGGANEVSDVAVAPQGWIAVGGKVSNICLGICDPIRAIAWTSPDGLDWTRSPTQASLADADFDAVTSTKDGFIAAGLKGYRAAVWTSTDGKTWTRRARSTFARPSANGRQPLVFGLAADGETVVAVGMDLSQDVGGHARAWASSDGRTWNRATVERSLDGQMFSVKVTARGFLAVGPSGACRGGIWESPDGRAWRCIARDRAFEGFGPSSTATNDVVEIAVGLTEVGWDEDSGEGMPGAIWWRPRP